MSDLEREKDSKNVIRGIAKAFHDSYDESDKKKRFEQRPISEKEAVHYALEYANMFIIDNELSDMASAFYLAVNHGYDGKPMDFGYDIALQSLGHGTRWHQGLGEDAARELKVKRSN